MTENTAAPVQLSTEHVKRSALGFDEAISGPMFDAWLAQHDAEMTAERDALAAILAAVRDDLDGLWNSAPDSPMQSYLKDMFESLSKLPADALAARDAASATSSLREAALDVDGFERFLDEVGDAPLAMQRWLFDRIEREAQ